MMKFLCCIAAVLCALQLQVQAASEDKVKWVMPIVQPKKGSKPSATKPINGQIIGGTLATAGQLPYQANLIMNGASICGGSLISDYFILTAAHCVSAPNVSIVVRLGCLNWRLSSEPNRFTATTTTKYLHPGYVQSTLRNDIALVRMPIPANLSPYVKTIRLPSIEDGSKTFAGYTATGSGWGRTSDTSTPSDVLYVANFSIITNAECQQTFGSTYVDSTNICVSGASGQSACKGDSGGPLIVYDGGRWKQVGVFSFVASTTCQGKYPQGFVRVTSFLTWIKGISGVDSTSNMYAHG